MTYSLAIVWVFSCIYLLRYSLIQHHSQVHNSVKPSFHDGVVVLLTYGCRHLFAAFPRPLPTLTIYLFTIMTEKGSGWVRHLDLDTTFGVHFCRPYSPPLDFPLPSWYSIIRHLHFSLGYESFTPSTHYIDKIDCPKRQGRCEMPDLDIIRVRWGLLQALHPLFLYAKTLPTVEGADNGDYGTMSADDLDHLKNKITMLRNDFKLNIIKQEQVDIDELVQEDSAINALQLDLHPLLETLEDLVDPEVPRIEVCEVSLGQKLYPLQINVAGRHWLSICLGGLYPQDALQVFSPCSTSDVILQIKSSPLI